jgi:hypothetical protein
MRSKRRRDCNNAAREDLPKDRNFMEGRCHDCIENVADVELLDNIYKQSKKWLDGELRIWTPGPGRENIGMEHKMKCLELLIFHGYLFNGHDHPDAMLVHTNPTVPCPFMKPS